MAIQGAACSVGGVGLGQEQRRFDRHIADEIALEEGHTLDATQNGPICQTFAIVLDTIGIKRSSPTHIVSKMLDLKGVKEKPKKN